MRNSAAMPTAAEDFYRASFPPHTLFQGDHTRQLSDSSLSSAYSTAIHTPGDSPPNHNLANPALKGPGHYRQTHIRATRVASSPYPRDTESVHSSSS